MIYNNVEPDTPPTSDFDKEIDAAIEQVCKPKRKPRTPKPVFDKPADPELKQLSAEIIEKRKQIKSERAKLARRLKAEEKRNASRPIPVEEPEAAPPKTPNKRAQKAEVEPEDGETVPPKTPKKRAKKAEVEPEDGEAVPPKTPKKRAKKAEVEPEDGEAVPPKTPKKRAKKAEVEPEDGEAAQPKKLVKTINEDEPPTWFKAFIANNRVDEAKITTPSKGQRAVRKAANEEAKERWAEPNVREQVNHQQAKHMESMHRLYAQMFRGRNV